MQVHETDYKAMQTLSKLLLSKKYSIDEFASASLVTEWLYGHMKAWEDENKNNDTGTGNSSEESEA